MVAGDARVSTQSIVDAILSSASRNFVENAETSSKAEAPDLAGKFQ
jgi:hypothetical protein